MGQGIESKTLRKLLTPITVGNLEQDKRIVVPALHLSYAQHGIVTDPSINFYVQRAAGPVGLMVPGCCRADDYGGGAVMVGLSGGQSVHEHGAASAAEAVLGRPGSTAVVQAVREVVGASYALIVPVAGNGFVGGGKNSPDACAKRKPRKT